jgi:hypothetical protein
MLGVATILSSTNSLIFIAFVMNIELLLMVLLGWNGDSPSEDG